MENEDNGKFIIKEKGKNYYYYGYVYGKHIYNAIRFKSYDEIPNEIRKDSTKEVIELKSEKGLELIATETKRLQTKLDDRRKRLEEIESAMNSLKGM